MAPLGLAGRSTWSWLAIVSSFRGAQAYPLVGAFEGATSLFSAVPIVAPTDSRSWPSWDPSSIFGGDSGTHTSKWKSKRGRLAGGRLHFATYAQPGFEQAMLDLCTEAEQTGFFAGTHCFKEVPKEAMSGRWNAIRRQKGVKAEWLYQPAMLQYLLRQVIPPGDTVLFAEASVDMSFNESKWSSILSLMGERNVELLAFQRSDTPEFVNTKGDVFRAFGVWYDDLEVKSYQISSNYFFMQNVRPVHLFLTKWASVLSDLSLLTDVESHAPNHKDFVEHHHEASLWSMMVKANRPGSSCRPSHRIQDLRLSLLPYSGCDDLRQVPAVPLQAHCLRHRKAVKRRLED